MSSVSRNSGGAFATRSADLGPSADGDRRDRNHDRRGCDELRCHRRPCRSGGMLGRHVDQLEWWVLGHEWKLEPQRTSRDGFCRLHHGSRDLHRDDRKRNDQRRSRHLGWFGLNSHACDRKQWQWRAGGDLRQRHQQHRKQPHVQLGEAHGPSREHSRMPRSLDEVAQHAERGAQHWKLRQPGPFPDRGRKHLHPSIVQLHLLERLDRHA